MILKAFEELMEKWESLPSSVAKTNNRNIYSRYKTGKVIEVSSMLKALYEFRYLFLSEFQRRPRKAFKIDQALEEAFRGWGYQSDDFKRNNREFYNIYKEKGAAGLSTCRKRKLLKEMGWQEGWVEVV